MSQYKVLPLCSMFGNMEWLYQSFEDEPPLTDEEVQKLVIDNLIEQGFKRIPPIFNRDGWYYDRKNKCSWYEWKGTAWLAEVKQFLYELGQLSFKPLEPAEIAAIKTLMVYGSCPRELRELLWKHEHNMQLRDIYRDAAKYRLQYQRESSEN